MAEELRPGRRSMIGRAVIVVQGLGSLTPYRIILGKAAGGKETQTACIQKVIEKNQGVPTQVPTRGWDSKRTGECSAKTAQTERSPRFARAVMRSAAR